MTLDFMLKYCAVISYNCRVRQPPTWLSQHYIQLTEQLQEFTLILNGPTIVSYSLPVLPEHCCTAILSTVSGSVSIETMSSLHNFFHSYSYIHDPATVHEKKEHSVLNTDRLDSTYEQTRLNRCLESSLVIQTIGIRSLTQPSQLTCQFDEEGISVASRRRNSVIYLQMKTTWKSLKSIEYTLSYSVILETRNDHRLVRMLGGVILTFLLENWSL